MAEINEEIRRVYEKQRLHSLVVARTSAQERMAKLKKLKTALWGQREALHKALCDDFRKNHSEADLTEVLPLMAEIKHTIKHLPEWMKPVRVKTPMLLFGTSSEIHYEPKGVVLILSPWNYPVNLLIGPLVSAIAAGNCAMLKPSSKVPNTAHFLKGFISDLFREEEVALFEGSSAISDELLKLRFDHIFFTGSTRIGRNIMAAAANHLTPVTLELGGKSPVIVDETADIHKAAERLMWGKFINAGQTCVAPDYLMIHEDRLDEFLSSAIAVLEERYGHDPVMRRSDPSYCRLVNESHHQGLVRILDQAVAKGARIVFGGLHDRSERYLEPTLLCGVKEDSPLMQEEIFGPILPILTFRDLSEPERIIRSQEKPLALYIFSESKAHIDRLLTNTSAGGTCVNTVMVHLVNLELPFGGVGESGMGSYHGFFGFKTMSHERAVLRQGRIDTLRVFYPPYLPRVQFMIKKAVEYLS